MSAHVPVFITADEAKDALTRAACTYEGRTLIHTLASGLGADWDLDAALAFVDRAVLDGDGAPLIAWSPHPFKHDLVVVAEERDVFGPDPTAMRTRQIRFDVPTPRMTPTKETT